MRMGQMPGFLGAWDLVDLPNKEVVLTIDFIRDEEAVAAGQKETVTAIHWTDKAYKPMVANVTNKKMLCKLYKTTDTEKLKGKSVIIGIEKVRAFGDVYDALRIRPRIPKVEAHATENAQTIKCEECNKVIVATAQMSAEQVAAYNKQRFGKCLCVECAKALYKGAQ